MYYLYRHIRLDKNEPFYIGIGTKQNRNHKSLKAEYNRAYSKNRKDSKIWKLIFAKTDYEVEILFESDDYEFIKEKEKEFIKLYGRIDKNTGCLANMTDGGDGSLGKVVSETTLEKMKIARKLKGAIHTCKVYQYNLNGEFIKEWNSIKNASDFCKVDITSLQKIVKRNLNNNYCKGYYWKPEYEEKIIPKEYKIVKRKSIISMLCPITGSVLKVFGSKKEANSYLGKEKSSGFLKYCIDNNKKGYGYYWKEDDYE